tara:strand:- start:1550 stop:1867 length:318 start_codon:yes stop_codon:yes gene_type:complete
MREKTQYKSKFSHGLMFHHFHDNKSYKKSQGSISKQEFEKIINLVGQKNILSPNEYIDRMLNNKLKKNKSKFSPEQALKIIKIFMEKNIIKDYFKIKILTVILKN